MSKRSIKVVKGIQGVMNRFYEVFYKFRNNDVKTLIESRDSIRNGFYSDITNFSNDELGILGNLIQVNELILDMVELRMAMEN